MVLLLRTSISLTVRYFRRVDDPDRPSERLVELRMRNRAMEALDASEGVSAFVASV
jgi:hypothetical protein